MTKRKFIASSLLYTLSGFLPAASTVLLLPLYLKLPISEYGTLEIYLTFTLLAQVLTMFSFDSSLYLYYHDLKSNTRELNRFISATFLLLLLLGIGSLVILGGTGFLMYDVVQESKVLNFLPWGLLAVVSGCFQGIIKVYTNLLQSQQKPVPFFLINVGVFLLILALTWVGLETWPQSLAGPVLARFAALAIMGILVLIQIFSSYGVHPDFTILKASLSFNIYAFLYQLVMWGINHYDKVFLAYFLVKNSIGIYAFAVKCLLVIEILIIGIQGSLYPRVLSLFAAQDKKSATPQINSYYYLLNGVVLILVLGAATLLPLIVPLFPMRNEYREAIPYFPLIASAYLFRGMRMYFSLPFSVLKDTRELPVLYLFVFGVKIGIMWLMMDQFQLYGAITGTLVAAAIEVLLLYTLATRKMEMRFNALKLIWVPVAVIVMVILTEFLPISRNWHYLIYFVALIVPLVTCYRREFLSWKT